MIEDKKQEAMSEFGELLEKNSVEVPHVGEAVKGAVLSASNAEVKIDIGGVFIGVVRGRELFPEADEYANLKPGDEVEATVVDEENENGELELSFRFAGQEKAWQFLRDAFENRDIIKVRISAANKGGLMVNFRQIAGFIPVSQLSPENYPRVDGGDKNKILLKLKRFIGQDFDVKVIALDERENKVIFSEKEAWLEKRKDVLSKYKPGSVVEGEVTAVTDFGVFIRFGENLEGLIHISELAWQRIDTPANFYKPGDKIRAEVVSMEGSKVFLSAKRLMKNPWEEVEAKYKVGQKVEGKVIKVNPFGLFVSLDDDIHGLAHANYLNLAPGQKILDAFKEGEKREFTIISLEPKDHRLGLAVKPDKEEKEKAMKEKKEEAMQEKTEEKKEKKEKKTKEKAAPKKRAGKEE